MTLPCEVQLHCQQGDAAGKVWCQDDTGMRSFSADYSAI